MKASKPTTKYGCAKKPDETDKKAKNDASLVTLAFSADPQIRSRIDRFVRADFTSNLKTITPRKTLMFANLAWIETFSVV